METQKIKIQEVLESANVNYGAFLIYSEVIEGARRPLVFFDTVQEDFSLIGSTGVTIFVPTATQLAATKLTSSIEDTISGGFTVANKLISKVRIDVTVFIYSAISLTDILKEDYPNIDWLRLHLHNMGKAVLEEIDADICSAYGVASSSFYDSNASVGQYAYDYTGPDGFGGYGAYPSSVTTMAKSAFDYTAITNALAAMAAMKWMAEPDNPPFLIMAPEDAAKLVQDTRFLLAARYYAGVTPDKLEGEVGLFAGCRVLQTPLLSGTGTRNAFIVFPPNFKWGPVAILAWKRKMRVREMRYEDKELSIFATTARCIPVVIQALGILMFNLS
jgi:hypothetical protein